MKKSTLMAVRRSAPYVSLLMLVGLAAQPMRQLPEKADVDSRNAAVKLAVDAVPYFIEPGWSGENVDVPAAAAEMLHASAILSRAYSMNGLEAQLIVVHCSDSRDMLGHWPPTCYPANGWEPASGGANRIDVPVGDGVLPVRVHRFERPGGSGVSQDIRVFGAFLLPDGSSPDAIDVLNSLAVRLDTASLGVAQLQVVTAGRMSDDQALAAASEILGGALPLLRMLGYGEAP